MQGRRDDKKRRVKQYRTRQEKTVAYVSFIKARREDNVYKGKGKREE